MRQKNERERERILMYTQRSVLDPNKSECLIYPELNFLLYAEMRERERRIEGEMKREEGRDRRVEEERGRERGGKRGREREKGREREEREEREEEGEEERDEE